MGAMAVKQGVRAVGRAPKARGLCLVAGSTVAGTRHIPGIRDFASAYEAGDCFSFERDRNNIYDEWAVRVFDANRRRVGYVSCECNEVVARLMDGGKRVFGRFEGVSEIDGWTRIEMGVYLDD